VGTSFLRKTELKAVAAVPVVVILFTARVATTRILKSLNSSRRLDQSLIKKEMKNETVL
jgi:hypothetical protein